MPHESGNAAWQPYPDTSTPIDAARLEAIENAIDRLAGGRRIKGPYSPGSYSALTSGSSGRIAGSVVVPDPGFDWQPVAFGSLEARCAANSRAAVGIYRNSIASANMIGHGSGLDPVNQGANGNGYWLINAQPWYGANGPTILAGATAAQRTIYLSAITDYGSGNIESTLFYAQLLVWVWPV